MSIGRAVRSFPLGRPIVASIARTACSNASGSSVVVSFAATLRKLGPLTPSGGV
jgi:hypothetical protein